jgi:hypothetical protein
VIVANRFTPLDAREAGRALFAAYAALTGRPPNDRVGALLVAQSALETGNWQKIHNFNFGNIKARADYPTLTQFRCSEVIDGVERFFDPPDPQCNFRAYATASEGALDYLKVLHGQAHWWQGLHSGDPSAFVDALATPPKYFTADPTKYKRAVTALFEQFLPLVTALLGRSGLRGAPPSAASPVSSSAPQSSLAPSTTGRSGAEPPSTAPAPNAAGNAATTPIGPGPNAAPTASMGKPATPGVIQVVEDAANAVVVAADAAEVIVTSTSALTSSGAAGHAAAFVRVVRWVAQFINWLLVALRLRKGAATKP